MLHLLAKRPRQPLVDSESDGVRPGVGNSVSLPGPGIVSGPPVLHTTTTAANTTTAINQTKRGPGGSGLHPVSQNADIPPVHFPGGRNPYLDRPLPLLPPPKVPSSAVIAETAMPVMRPSTSSGPVSSRTNISNTPDFNKRISRDDMALNLGRQPSIGRQKKGLQPYIIGVKGPTPEPSPYNMPPSSTPMSSSLSIPHRVRSPESVMSGVTIQIGMALGSPSHPPLDIQSVTGWDPQFQGAPAQDVFTPPPPPPPERTPEVPVRRQGTIRKRLFGSLFGSKKHADSPKPSDTVGSSNAPIITTTQASATPWSEESVPSRSKSLGGKWASKHKPIIIRSQTDLPLESTVAEPKDTTVPTGMDFGFATSQTTASNLTASGNGLLDIEIPDIRLERYSVMFSGVLNPHQGNGSSLLARRQATLERLKTINDPSSEGHEVEGARQRSATSPQPSNNSPTYTLFSQTPGSQHLGIAMTTSAASSQTSLRRSNTSPAHLPSPARRNFAPEDRHHLHPQHLAEQKERKRVTIVSPRTMDERDRAAQVERLREQQQQQDKQARGDFHFGPDETGLVLNSPNSFSDNDDEIIEVVIDSSLLPLRPELPEEPQWQMISPPSSKMIGSASSASSSSSSSTSSIASAASTSTSASYVATPHSALHQHQQQPPKMPIQPTHQAPPPPPPQFSPLPDVIPSTDAKRPSQAKDDESDDEENGEAALKAAVEISIARQISISRQQRQLLQQRPATVRRPNHTQQQTGPRLARSASAAAATMATGTMSSGSINLTNKTGPTVLVVSGRRRKNSSAAEGVSPLIATATATAAGDGEVTRVGVADTKLGSPALVHNMHRHRKSERVVLEDL